MQTKIQLKRSKHTSNPFTALCINVNVEPMYRTWGDLAPR